MTTQQQTNENNFQDIDMDVSAGSEFPLPEDRNGEFINSDELSRKQRAVNLAKRKRVSTPPSDEFPPLRIINNFAPLRNLNEKTVPEQPQITASPRPRIQKPAMPKSGTPPPIILHGKPEKHQELTQLLVEVAKSGHMLKYSRNRTTITTKHADERKLLISRLESICAERTRLGTRHRRTRENRTAPERDLSDEKHRQENAKARILLNCQIIWERHENKRQIIQCRNCQEWGHATSNCYAEVVCMVCAENHPTRDCTVNKEELVKCANCAGNLRASSTLCPSYQRRV
ncbi:uncharacterized protein LOC135129436 [Zophobas morio]|uniref:uncharacterized protein LOC135129436 n=1 Tax=Zophobas morio TaxID=2755281 RepID=UPI0030835DE8